MISKQAAVEAFLAEIEEKFYSTLQGDNFETYLGGRVDITYTAKPRLEISIRELGKSGPKKGQKFRKRVGPSKAAIREMQEDTEEFLQ